MQLGRVGSETAPGEVAEWTFVVGRSFLVVVPATAGTSLIASLHALAAEPAVPIESIVALIPLGTADDVDSFAVIVPGGAFETHDAGSADAPHDGIPVHAVVRGAIAVDVFSIGGSRRFTDRNIRPWLLAEFQAVTGLVIGSPLAAVSPADRLGSGRPVGTGLATGDTLFWAVAGHAAEAGDTILRPGRIVGDTVMWERPDTAAPVAPPADRELAAPADRAGSPSADPVAPPVAPPGAPPVPQERYRFRLAPGDDRTLDKVYRIGRSPRPRRIPSGEQLELVRVASPTDIVSGNHLEIRQDGDAVVVTDLGSTNGTLVRFALGRTQRLRSGASLTVLPGTTVDIGDGNLIEILPAD